MAVTRAAANMTRRNDRRCFGSGILIVSLLLLLGGSTPAVGQIRIGVGIALPGLSIGINIPGYPELVPIPGYPVYYAPRVNANLFFYDGLYWVLVGDDWYYSSWYDGPWYLAQSELVPDFILRIPILYYRSPPPYFLHWNRAAPPRWGEHWGRAWEAHRRGWNHWDRAAVPPRAPLPGYQRQYPRGRYPGADQQRTLENRFYPYTPRDPRDRNRLEQTPQFGRRVAPQQRPPARAERRPPDVNRPGWSARGQPAQRPQRKPRQPAREERRNEPQPRGGGGRGHRPPDRPPT